ncbi:MAG TPA: hypothetical protein V6D15_08425 [Oculatellaceae cyanobacterium]|jgi:hypothetical protein
MIPTKTRVKVQLLDNRHALVNLTPTTAYITYCLKRPGKGGRLARVEAAYFGFSNYDEATAFCQQLQQQKIAKRVILRESQRLATAYEVKVNGLNDAQILELSQPQQQPAPTEPTLEEVATPSEANEKYLAGDKVEIGSDRHGKELVWELGNVTATDLEGATVDINGATFYYLNDEIALLRDTLFTPEPKLTFSFIAASSNNNLSQQFHCYEGNYYIGKIDQLPISGKWIIKHDRRDFDSREAATTALKLKLEADKRLHDETNKAMLNRFLSA